jgi:hypothetical protein
LQRTGYRSFWDVAFSIVEQISRRLRRLFQVLSEAGDGGRLLPTSAKDLGKQLAWAVTLIRGRYIVEFPRPVTTVGRPHSPEITISRRDAFIRAAGAEFPTNDPAILNDPTTVPPDLSRSPELGNRKILTPH